MCAVWVCGHTSPMAKSMHIVVEPQFTSQVQGVLAICAVHGRRPRSRQQQLTRQPQRIETSPQRPQWSALVTQAIWASQNTQKLAREVVAGCATGAAAAARRGVMTRECSMPQLLGRAAPVPCG